MSSIPDEVVIEEDDWKEEAEKKLKKIKWHRAFSYLKCSNSEPVKNLAYSLKNSIYIRNKLITGASNSLLNHYPPFSSTIHRLLKEGKAINLYSCSLDEFGMGSLGVFGNKGLIHNSHCKFRACGGSSSGSAYLVSKGMVDFSIGTDTGGSGRTPASFNSIYGFKPSYGLISREGILPLSTLFDTPAILSNSIDIAARVLTAISAPDPLDLTTIKTKKKNYHKISNNPSKDLSFTPIFPFKKKTKVRFLVLKEFIDYPQKILSQQERTIRENFFNLVSRLRMQPGCEVISDSLDWPPILLAELIYKIVVYSELVTHYLSLNGIITPWNKTTSKECQLEKKSKRGQERIKKLEVDSLYLEKAKKIRVQMGMEVKIRHLIGYFFLYKENYHKIYLQARKILNLYHQKISKLLSSGGILLTPTTNNIAPMLEDCTTDYTTDIPQSVLLISNFSGSPAISIPWLHFQAKGKHPSVVYIGLHLTCKSREDKYLLAGALFLEKNKLL